MRAKVVATNGPKTQVTGASTKPTRGELALSRRLTPCAGHSQVVEKMFNP